MRLIVALLACLCLCEWAQALADPASQPAAAQPAAPATAAHAPSAASSTATTSLAPPGPAAASAPPAGSGVSAQDDKRLRAQGYKVTVSKGETYYCRSEQVLGTRFEHKVCRTPEQVSADRNNGRDETNKAQIETKNSK